MIGLIFTNYEHAIRKENDCYAYQIIEIKQNEIYAVPLEIETIDSPKTVRLSHLYECGNKILHYPIKIDGEPELFQLTSFGKNKCIINENKCLIEYDSMYKLPIWDTISDLF